MRNRALTLALAVATLTAVQVAEAAEINLKIANVVPRAAPRSQGAILVAKMVNQDKRCNLNAKDYPGGWAHYRLFDDGHFRQEARRTASARALEHAARCREFFDGGYRRFALGSLGERSFSSGSFSP